MLGLRTDSARFIATGPTFTGAALNLSNLPEVGALNGFGGEIALLVALSTTGGEAGMLPLNSFGTTVGRSVSAGIPSTFWSGWTKPPRKTAAALELSKACRDEKFCGTIVAAILECLRLPRAVTFSINSCLVSAIVPDSAEEMLVGLVR